MLILWRAFDERLLIGDDIVVTVVAVRGHKVAIGIDAPKSVRVDREEVRRQREAAAETVVRPAGDGWYAATDPNDPAVNTQGRTAAEALDMAEDARKALRAARRKLS